MVAPEILLWIPLSSNFKSNTVESSSSSILALNAAVSSAVNLTGLQLGCLLPSRIIKAETMIAMIEIITRILRVRGFFILNFSWFCDQCKLDFKALLRAY